MEGGYKKLIVWQEAKKLVVLTYQLTNNFPRCEEFGLKAQMRRAAVSVLANLAEGWLRRSIKDKLHFLEIAEGSLLELESEGEVCFEIKYWLQLEKNRFDAQKDKASYLLYKYKKVIENKS